MQTHISAQLSDDQLKSRANACTNFYQILNYGFFNTIKNSLKAVAGGLTGSDFSDSILSGAGNFFLNAFSTILSAVDLVGKALQIRLVLKQQDAILLFFNNNFTDETAFKETKEKFSQIAFIQDLTFSQFKDIRKIILPNQSLENSALAQKQPSINTVISDNFDEISKTALESALGFAKSQTNKTLNNVNKEFTTLKNDWSNLKYDLNVKEWDLLRIVFSFSSYSIRTLSFPIKILLMLVATAAVVSTVGIVLSSIAAVFSGISAILKIGIATKRFIDFVNGKGPDGQKFVDENGRKPNLKESIKAFFTKGFFGDHAAAVGTLATGVVLTALLAAGITIAPVTIVLSLIGVIGGGIYFTNYLKKKHDDSKKQQHEKNIATPPTANDNTMANTTAAPTPSTTNSNKSKKENIPTPPTANDSTIVKTTKPTPLTESTEESPESQSATPQMTRARSKSIPIPIKLLVTEREKSAIITRVRSKSAPILPIPQETIDQSPKATPLVSSV